MDIHKIKKITHYALLVSALLSIVTGYGITKYKTVTALSFGFFDKARSFQWHEPAALIFIILMVLHLYFVMQKK